MLTTFAIHPAASKQLIARAAAALPEVQWALEHGRIFIGTGTTNIPIAEALLNTQITNPDSHVAGVIAQQSACVTDPNQRSAPWCIEKGKLIDIDWLEFIQQFEAGDIFIKGANAVDPSGNVGILLANPLGGTIGQALGILKARGIQIIAPVGLEKMIPSCIAAEKRMGINRTGIRLGFKTGYMVVTNPTLITEIESLKILFGVEAVQVAAGGVGGMEGSVVLAFEYEDEKVSKEVISLVKKLNRKPPLKIAKQKCAQCSSPCMMRSK